MNKRIFLIFCIFLCCLKSYTQNIPEVNQKILEYVKTQIGKKVGAGECWDLAYQALSRNNCEWDGKYNYGKKLNPQTDSIYPGDIIQFHNVVLKYKQGRMIYKEDYAKHTAIIYNVKDNGVYDIAHQNNGYSGRKVGISELNLNNKVAGTIDFFRPVSKTTE